MDGQQVLSADDRSESQARNQEVMKNILVRNDTMRRIAIERKGGGVPLLIPPFGDRELSQDEHEAFDFDSWEQMGLIHIDRGAKPAQAETGLAALGWSFIFLVLKLVIPSWRANNWFWLLVAVPAVVLGLYHAVKRQGLELGQQVKRSFSLLVVVLAGIVLPGVVIYYFGGVGQFVSVRLPGQWPPALLGRGVELAFIAIASLTPALLYFLFNRQQLGTLREMFYHDIIKLDPKVVSVGCAKAKYGKRIDEVYGPEDDTQGRRRLPHMTHVPVIGTTFVLALGWIVVLAPFGPIAYSAGAGSYLRLLMPAETAISFGFLGAYFFSVQMVLRRYARADLKPKAYSHITVRVLSVIILAWIISVLSWIVDGGSSPVGATATEPVLLVVVFLVGIVPESGLAIIVKYARGQSLLGHRFHSILERHPLSKLEGINLYDRARLLEEGIENIENLVNHDFVDLILQTRIPLPRLVDWIDQGILYMHTVHTWKAEAESPGGGTEASAAEMASLNELRKYGIRTATDLLVAHEAALARDEEAMRAGEAPVNVDRLLGILDGADQGPKRLEVILDTLLDDEWLAHVRSWRQYMRSGCTTYTIEEFRREMKIA